MELWNFALTFESFLLLQVNSSNFKKGDIVQIADDEALVSALQEGHGGWISAMKSVSEAFALDTLCD